MSAQGERERERESKYVLQNMENIPTRSGTQLVTVNNGVKRRFLSQSAPKIGAG
jgi:hypothetical protein